MRIKFIRFNFIGLVHGPMSYTRLYDSALLDDIHNYFPALLYAPDRFQTVGQVLDYVQQQTRSRFDLYSRGRREYNEQTRVVSTPPVRRPEVSMVFESPVFSYGLPGARQENSQQETAQTVAQEFLGALNLMNGLFSSPVLPTQHRMAPAGFADPVVVRPTAEQIQSATAIERVDSDDEACAICQDTLAAGSSALALNECGHRFHEGCIRTWLNASVFCPVCRHDIREPASEDH
jgi:hypothetical protein